MKDHKNIVISGGTGLIGSNLVEKLLTKKYNVFILTRSPEKYTNTDQKKHIFWDPIKGKMKTSEISSPDAIINLAGAPIVDKAWTEKYKKLIIDSRVKSAKMLEQWLRSEKLNPSVYIGASAIGIYGDSGQKVVTENDQGDTKRFIVHSVIEWEKGHQKVIDYGIRSCIFRIGLVLSKDGGILEKMLTPAKLGLYSYFGNGTQYQSWIHIDDLTNMMIYALENKNVAGTFNGVAPNPVDAKAFAKVLKSVMGFGIVMPAPAFALKIGLGERHKLLLDSVKASSAAIEKPGFKFSYPDLKSALIHEL